METFIWYESLVKPSWAPPSWIFGPVWTFLYLIIAITFGQVFALALKNKLPRAIALPFLWNLVFNFLFTPLQFWLKNNYLALIDIVLVLSTLLISLKLIYRVKRWIAILNIPYLAWVGFATVLQLSITILNINPPPSTSVHLCAPSDRTADFCIQLYQPVCATVAVQCIKAPCPPIQETFSNSCVACKNSLVTSYVNGSCESLKQSK